MKNYLITIKDISELTPRWYRIVLAKNEKKAEEIMEKEIEYWPSGCDYELEEITIDSKKELLDLITIKENKD